MYLIQSSNVYKQTELLVSDSTCQCSPLKGNIGSLPTLFNQDGSFNHEANSYLFYQKAIKQLKIFHPALKHYKLTTSSLKIKDWHGMHSLPSKGSSQLIFFALTC
jgi:hypothetical protein